MRVGFQWKRTPTLSIFSKGQYYCQAIFKGVHNALTVAMAMTWHSNSLFFKFLKERRKQILLGHKKIMVGHQDKFQDIATCNTFISAFCWSPVLIYQLMQAAQVLCVQVQLKTLSSLLNEVKIGGSPFV